MRALKAWAVSWTPKPGDVGGGGKGEARDGGGDDVEGWKGGVGWVREVLDHGADGEE